MKVLTKYNVGQEVKFHPFNNKNMRPVTGVVAFIDVRIAKKITIEYAINDKHDGMKWNVDESDILN